MASFFDTLKADAKKVLTPIADRLRIQFGLSSDEHQKETPAPTPKTIATTSTPLADSLATRFNIAPPSKQNSRASFEQQAEERQSQFEETASPFIKNLFGTGGDILRKMGGAGDSFLNTNAKNIADFASGKLTLQPSDWVSGLEKTVAGPFKLTGSLSQAFNEGVLRIGTSIADASLPGYKEQHKEAGPSPLLASITGVSEEDQGKADTYQQIFKAANVWALDKSATPNGAKAFAGFAVLGTILGDEPGVGGALGAGEKAVFKMSKDALAEAAKEGTDEGVQALLKRENPTLSDSAIQFLTPLYRDARTPEEAEQITKFVKGAQQTAAENANKKSIIEAGKQGYEPLRDLMPEEIDTHLANLDTPEIKEARALTAKGTPTQEINTEERNVLRDAIVRETYGDGAAKQGKRLDLVIGAPASGKSTIVEDLAREHGSIVPDADAIKKMLPEYGIKGEGSQLVHAESTRLAAEVRKIAREKGDNTILQMVGGDPEQVAKSIKAYHDAGYDIHLHHVELAPEKAAARAVDRFKKGGHFIDPAYILREVGIKPSKAYDILKNDERLASYQKLSNDVERGAAPRRIESGGRSIPKESERHGFNDDSGGRSPTGAAENRAISPNLVKTLGSAKDPYEVLNILKNEFPNLPDKVIDRMVSRFVRTKRIETVESLIRSGRDLDARFKQGEIIAAGKSSVQAGEKGLAQSAKEVLDETLNPVVRKMMRQDEKIRLITTIKNRFEKPEEAVAAAAEYDRIWDDVNQKIVDQYENLSLQKSFLEDALSSDDEGIASVFKKLFMGPNKKNAADDSVMELQEIHGRAVRHKKAIENYRRTGASGDKLYPGNPGKLTKTEEYAVELDKYLQDSGIEGGDFSEAQERIERYAAMRTEVDNIKEQLKELKPRVREARILQEGLADIAIVPKQHVQAIDRIVNAANFRDYFKDISGFAGQARDIYRNFERFFGEKYAEVKKAVLDPFDEAKGHFVDLNKDLADNLDDEVVKKFGFRRGSKESAAIQRYGDTDLPDGLRMSRDDLVNEFGKEKAANIIAADKFFRETYDRLIDELNAVRKKIYPNTPGKLIAKRANYYRHFTDLTESWGDALREFFDTPSGIDPNLVGLSEFTKAKSRFLPFAEKREGQATKLDAIGGFVDYIPAFAYAKEIEPTISTFRYLRSKLAGISPKAGEELELPNGKKFRSKGAESFLGFLDDFARDLTGNTNPMDRWTQRVVGRRTIRAARFVNNRMKANSITTFSSALAQVFNVPAGIADTKLYAAKGLKRSFGGLVVENEPLTQSIFLKERFAQSASERFPFQFKNRPVKATGDLLKKQASWVLRAMDMAGTKFIWNSEYEKALALKTKGEIEDAVKYADDKTRKMVAGRGIGEVPLGQKALTAQFVFPFTLEVGNAWWIMKDWVDERDAGALMTFFVANYAMNEIAEQVRGSRVAIDPINSLIEGSIALSNEWEEGDYARGAVKLLGRQAGEILANIPLGQQAAAIVPDSGVQKITQYLTGAPMDKQEVFGNSMISGRFGTPLIVSGLEDAVYRLLPPVGGIQLKKTYQGLMSLLHGVAEDSKGRVSFAVSHSPQNIARALAFGADATSEARKHFEGSDNLFERIDRQAADTFVRKATAEKDWTEIKKLAADGRGDEAADELTEIAAKDPLEAKAIMEIAKDEKLGLTSNDRLVKMLNVQNGERAKYIVEQLKDMKTGDEKADYIEDLAAKKLINKEVINQISLLLGSIN